MSNEQEQPAPKPHHMGHRDRLRQRFVKGGAASLADYELLELLLFMCIPRRDVKPLAKNLIKDFGSFAAVLNASIPDLVKASGISENTAIALHSVRAAAHHLTVARRRGRRLARVAHGRLVRHLRLERGRARNGRTRQPRLGALGQRLARRRRLAQRLVERRREEGRLLLALALALAQRLCGLGLGRGRLGRRGGRRGRGG